MMRFFTYEMGVVALEKVGVTQGIRSIKDVQALL